WQLLHTDGRNPAPIAGSRPRRGQTGDQRRGRFGNRLLARDDRTVGETTMAEKGIYEAMRTPRAVRRLRPDPSPDDVLHGVIEAATWAPTGGNRQPWRIVVVKDLAKKERLGALYTAQWNGFIGHYRAAAASAAPDARAQIEKTLKAGDYLASHMGEV